MAGIEEAGAIRRHHTQDQLELQARDGQRERDEDVEWRPMVFGPPLVGTFSTLDGVAWRGRLDRMADQSSGGERKLRVMLVDDHEVVRDGIKALLHATEDLTVVSEAGSVAEAVRYAASIKPDIVVMDVRLADGSGIEATREIRAQRQETQVLMLTSFADDEALFASIMAGAAGYVLKQIRGGELVHAIRMVARGQSLLDPAITATVLDRLRKGKHLLRDERLARLSGQEERILALVAEGWTNRQIGAELHLAEKTVKNYVSSILSKLEVARRAEAAAYLARHSRLEG